MFCHLGHFYFIFFWSWRLCYLKGWSFRCSLGLGNAGRCAVRLHVGGGVEREQWRPPHSPPDFSLSLCYPQSNWAPLVLVPEWVACAHPGPLWVSPTTSPVRLGVFPAAAPTPMGVFNQRFEALFLCAGALGCAVCFPPCHLSGLSAHQCGAAGCYPPLCLPHSLPL